MSEEAKVCAECGVAEAVIHLTQIVDNEMETRHLCERCAAAKGVETSNPTPNVPLADFLAQMGSDSPEAPAADTDGDSCGFCGLSLSDFRETGRLGCPHCYATFDDQLRNLLRRIHGSVHHVGKVYLPPDPSDEERSKRLEGLHRKLRRAVEAEDFEKAADLRDQIRALEPSGS